MLRTAPKLNVVCWQTLAEDNAARAFSVGFYNNLAAQLEREARRRKRWRDESPFRRCRRYDGAPAHHMSPRLLRRLPPMAANHVGAVPAPLPHAAASSPAALATLCCPGRRRPSSRISIEAAFTAGCDKFRQRGFKFGDPEQYLHPPGHPHHLRPDFVNCPHCTPPVHGQVRGSVQRRHRRLAAQAPHLPLALRLHRCCFSARSMAISLLCSEATVQPTPPELTLTPPEKSAPSR